MRYIDLDELEDNLPPLLLQAAEGAKAEVLAASPDARTDVIKAHAKIWADLKQYFENHFHSKCWYTESKNPGCDMDIDHFRPKGEVYESNVHPGYWWLAFDWHNYRFSCQFSNRLRKDPKTDIKGGKGTHFPLFIEGSRACSEEDDCDEEIRVLLDPCSPIDPQLLSFEIDGKPTINSEFSGDPDAVRRVEVSKQLMNIDFHTFNDERQKLYMKIRRRIRDADKYFQLGNTQAFSDAVRDLASWTKRIEPYSSAARIYLRGFRDRKWVQLYLNEDL